MKNGLETPAKSKDLSVVFDHHVELCWSQLEMPVHGYFDRLKRCQKRMALFKFGFLVCLTEDREHADKENMY